MDGEWITDGDRTQPPPSPTQSVTSPWIVIILFGALNDNGLWTELCNGKGGKQGWTNSIAAEIQLITQSTDFGGDETIIQYILK